MEVGREDLCIADSWDINQNLEEQFGVDVHIFWSHTTWNEKSWSINGLNVKNDYENHMNEEQQ